MVRNKTISLVLLTSICFTQTLFGQNSIKPPSANKIPKYDTIHGDVRIDNYYWMQDKSSKMTIDYLEAENKYLHQVLQPNKELENLLYEEIVGRIKETDLSAPYKLRGYWYYKKSEQGKDYPIFCRKKGNLDAVEEIVLDENKFAEGHNYYSIDWWNISPNSEIISFEVDTVGDLESYDVYFKNLNTGELFNDHLQNAQGQSIAWAKDNKTVFYTIQDDANRGYKVYKHVLGSNEQDILIFHEKDERFSIWMHNTKSGRYIMLYTLSNTSTECWFLNADRPDDTFQVFHPREEDHTYYKVSDNGDKFFLMSNKDALNQKIVVTDIANPGIENWKDFIPHRENVYLDKFELFKDYLTITERENGLDKIRIIKLSDMSETYIDFGESTYTVYPTWLNPEYNTEIFRYRYSSMITPTSTYDYNMEMGEKTLVKQTEVVGGYDKNDYITERIWAEANDGTQIPISLVYKKGIDLNGSNPLILFGYSAYGGTRSNMVHFESERLSLLDRGFIYANAHVRGSSYMGTHWYDQGKLLNKKNSITDFIACTEHLIKTGYTSKGKVIAHGISAGGIIMGAIANMRPNLYKAIILEAPFVDVTNRMLDASITYTTVEYEEWGNPNEQEYYEYINSYSPYDNVKKQAYPNMLFITGLYDQQVSCSEPAKMVAKLRDLKTDDNIVLLKTDMSSGHAGPSGRYAQYGEVVFMYAYILSQFGITE